MRYYSLWYYSKHPNIFAALKKNKHLQELGNLIRELRKNKGLSQEQLALQAEVDRSYVGGIERGERNVSFFSFTKDNFFISLKAWSSEVYVSLYETKNFPRDILVSLVYEKETDKWKIRNFHIGDRRIFGNTYSQWLQEAKNDKRNKKELPALLKVLAVQPLLKPAPFIEYVLDDSTKEFIEGTTNGSFSSEFFPIKFPNIKSKPEIYSIQYRPIINTEEILPLFNYKTNFSLENESSMQNEVNFMVENLKTIFPGIENQFSGLIFSANKEIPSNYKNVPYFNLVFKFK